MTTLRPFRRSTYLTLAFACACGGYAEFAVLPEAAIFAGLVVVSLLVMYRVEERVSLLSIPDANKLGAGLFLLCVLWIAVRFVREARVGTGTGWQLLSLAVLGPIVMVLIPAKLARADKHTGDYWALHGLALVLVVLSAALADDGVCVALIAAYALCAIWSLGQFAPARAGGLVPPVPVRSGIAADQPRAVEVGGAKPGGGFGRALAWGTAAACMAVGLFLLTPRSSFGKLEIGRPRMEIGYSSDPMVDLNRVGNLRSNPEVAFEVLAEEADGRPKDDLPLTQRWRGKVLAGYAGGVWKEADTPFPQVARSALTAGPWSPPDLGPGRYRLTFTVPAALKGLFLADPVAWVAGQPSPVASLDPDGTRPWYPGTDGSFLRIPTPASTRLTTIHYVQHTRPEVEADLGPGFELARPLDLEDPNRQRVLVHNPVSRVKDYADDLLDRLIREGKVPTDARLRAGAGNAIRLRPSPDHHEAIARAFRDHLASTSTLLYSRKLQRADAAIDPVEEFLFHTHLGHCERFASALVLLLRSEGIPAVLVLGFKGCENTGPGRYAVRQDFAHAWAEVLISRPTGVQKSRTWHWLSLDPEPIGEASDDGPGDGWLERTVGTAEHFLFNYTPEQREAVVRWLRSALVRPETLGVIGGLVAVALIVPRLRFGRFTPLAASPPAARWFDQLLAVLAPHGYAPAPGQTPLEFAHAVRDSLLTRSATAGVADVPVAWAEAYYDDRFGGNPTPAPRRAALEDKLAELRQALNEKDA